MSFTGVGSPDRSIDESNAWLADIEEGFGTHDRRLAYRAVRAWPHSLRDHLTVKVAAQLPELLRGVFYDGWNPSRVPLKYGRPEYVARFAREARIHQSDVPKASAVVTATVRQHVPAGAVEEAFALLPGDLRELLEPTAELPTGSKP